MNEILIQIKFIGDVSEDYNFQAMQTMIDGVYGYGNTPKEALEHLLEQLGSGLE